MLLSIEIIAFLFTMFAYIQSNRTKFLIVNSFAILFVGLSFYFKEGYVGAYVELMMLLVHLVALLISENLSNKIKMFAPLLAFILVYTINDSSNPIYMAIAVSFFVLGVYQYNMIVNKIFFSIGLIFLSFYSFILGTYVVFTANIVGIVILMYSIYKLKSIKK
jgi:hypothetical protein